MNYKEIMEILKTRNVFLTGKGGTGKSYITNKIINYYKEQDKRIAVLGSTGIAAANIKGQTIHSFFKIGINKNFKEFNDKLEFIQNDNYRAYLKIINYLSYLKYYSLIIIDEVSMVSADLLDLIYFILKEFKFKGKVLLVGDFLQLPPVEKEGKEVKFAFESKAWKEFNLKCIELQKIYRTDNNNFIYALNKLREGDLDDKALNYFLSLTSKENMENVKKNIYTILCSTNKQVDKINKLKLDKIEGEAFINYRKISYNHDGDENSFNIWLEYNKSKIKSFLDALLCDKEFKYKIGSQVMFINNNIKEEDGEEKFIWYNGEKGTIIDYFETDKLVKNDLTGKEYEKNKSLVVLKENGEKVIVDIACWELSYLERIGNRIDKNSICSVYQYPLKLAYSATIHKCVSGDTYINTKQGLKKIKDLPGMSMLSAGNFNNNCNFNIINRFGKKKVKQIFYGGEEDTLILKTSKGYEIECSLRHPLLGFKNNKYGYFKSPEFKIGDNLVISAKKNINNKETYFNDFKRKDNCIFKKYTLPNKMTNDLAWMLGLLVGDGSYAKSYKRDGRVDLANVDKDIIERYTNIVQNIFGQDIKNYDITYRFCNVGVRRFLYYLGLDYVIHYNKDVPKKILENSKYYPAFLQGLFDADGYCSKKGNMVIFTTSSKKLANNVHHMLLQCGVIGKKDKVNKKYYRIEITSNYLNEFNKYIGFFCKRKKVPYKYNYNTIKSNVGQVPDGKNILNKLLKELKNNYYYNHKYSKKNFLKYNREKYKSWVANSKNPTYTQFKWFLLDNNYDINLIKDSEIKEHAYNSINDCFIDRIVSIKKSKNKVYDIHIEDKEEFISNGFVSHNSQGQSIDNLIVNTKNIFAPSQFYVGLSRATNPDNLYIHCKNNPELYFKKISKVNPKVIEFYKNLG